MEGLEELISGAEEIEKGLTDISKSEVGSIGPATVITIIVLGIVTMPESCFTATETNIDMLEASLGAEHNTKTTSSAGGAGASI